LREVRVDRADLDTQPEIAPVDAALLLGRRGGEAGRLVDQILKVDVLALKTGVADLMMLFEMTSIWFCYDPDR